MFVYAYGLTVGGIAIPIKPGAMVSATLIARALPCTRQGARPPAPRIYDKTAPARSFRYEGVQRAIGPLAVVWRRSLHKRHRGVAYFGAAGAGSTLSRVMAAA